MSRDKKTNEEKLEELQEMSVHCNVIMLMFSTTILQMCFIHY